MTQPTFIFVLVQSRPNCIVKVAQYASLVKRATMFELQTTEEVNLLQRRQEPALG